MTITDIESAKSTMPNLSHGLLSKALLMPWEDADAYQQLLHDLQAEYVPIGQTEKHLVEEIAGIMWRKQRLRIAEAAHFRKQLSDHMFCDSHVKAALIQSPHKVKYGRVCLDEALRHGDAYHAEKMAIAQDWLKAVQATFTHLQKHGDYEKALTLLPDLALEWWKDYAVGLDADEEYNDYEATAESLTRFIEAEMLPFYEAEREKLAAYPLIKQHFEADAVTPSKTHEKFSRYEVHLDRKFERMLTVLLRLQEMRENKKSKLA